MAIISVTAANVALVSGANVERGFLLGGTVTAGQAVYLSSSNTWIAADTDSSATTAAASGVALNGGASGQPVAVAKAGCVVNMGGTVAIGTVYILDGDAGGICPVTDIATNDWTTVIGVGLTAANLQLIMVASGVQKAA